MRETSVRHGAFWCVSLLSLVLISCAGNTEPAWVADADLLQEIASLDPETESKETGRAITKLFRSASTRNGTEEPTDQEETKRNREAFGQLRNHFSANVSPNDGFNVCFPQSYPLPEKARNGYLARVAYSCRLIQANGPSVTELRKDRRVAKYLNESGPLEITDPGQAHQDFTNAIYQRDPNNEQASLYSEAVTRTDRIN